ncbi:MAG: hypothetical protein JNM93_13765 [Bacteriovoracaceae bacterium]|nr:hypothetical protein [Bacteriovoracaceae bacterium]
MIKSLHFLALLFIVFGCSKGSESLLGSGGDPTTPPTPITGKYCTSWVNFRASATTPSMSLVCLKDNAWVEDTNPIDESAECGPSKIKHYGYPELFLNENQEILVGYEECPGFGEETIMKVRKFDETTGWSNFTDQNIIYNLPSGKPIEVYSQFGATYFSAFNRVYSFWSAEMGNKSYLSYTQENGNWTRIALPETAMLRHPEHYASPDGKHYVYYAQPQPRAFEVLETGIVDLGKIIPAANEYTLYSSFVIHNGQAVIAYSSDINDASWYDQVSKIKVAFHQGGTTWNINTDAIIETPGRDGMTPHLFSHEGELYIMYPDQTTTGPSPSYNNIRFRMRVKKYDGTNWIRVGGESETIWLSQRFEYTQDEGRILFTALALDPDDATQLVKRVIAWENGAFAFVGNPLSVKGNKAAAEHWSRPGKVIVLESDI